MKCPKNILFYGTDTLSTSVLKTLNQRGHPILTVTKSTTTPVYKFCKQHNLPVDVFTKSRLPFGSKKECFREHLGVVTSFGGLIPGRVIRGGFDGPFDHHWRKLAKKGQMAFFGWPNGPSKPPLISSTKLGFVNVHPSLIPQYQVSELCEFPYKLVNKI